MDRTLDVHGLTWSQAREAFIEFYNEAVREAGVGVARRLDVVHGYGSTGPGGVIRGRLRRLLEGSGASLEFTPGEALDGNPGHTVVAPMTPLPAMAEELAELVYVYCERPRSMSKIAGRFRRHGSPNVRAAVSALERQGKLRVVTRGSVKLYEAV
jgi:hypothetical protein